MHIICMLPTTEAELLDGEYITKEYVCYWKQYVKDKLDLLIVILGEGMSYLKHGYDLREQNNHHYGPAKTSWWH